MASAVAVQANRVALFEEIQARHARDVSNIAGDPISVTLPDGAVKVGNKWVSTPMDIAEMISPQLAASCLVARVNGDLWDMKRPLEHDCELKLLKFDSREGRDTFWHSSAHILAQALETADGCKLCTGPCSVRESGFYYDVYYDDGMTLTPSHMQRIEARAREVVEANQPFERIVVSRDEAAKFFPTNKFKLEIISELPRDQAITIYRCGPLVDLCPGPHIPNTSFVKAFACLEVSSSYWRGDSRRESLQRVYGISFPDSKRLMEHNAKMEEDKNRDHRILGPSQELFFFHPMSPGSCFFTPKGTIIVNTLLGFLRQEYSRRGYQEVHTPNIYNMELWKTSGHAKNYENNMFDFEIDNQKFGLKPMNCPGHCLIYRNRSHSYRDLPLRIADFGVLHINEFSGALTGLNCVRKFQQDDAHIFCRESQIKEEVKGVLEFIKDVYSIFGFQYELELSTRPKNYMGDIATWNKAEEQLKDALEEFGKSWQFNEGDGAFDGPKIDIGVFDAMKRKFQCATIQLDYQLPIKFKLTYSVSNDKFEMPVIIHRAILGSVERMFAILLEHYNGKWPLWLSPRQAIVCSQSHVALEYAKKVHRKMRDAGFHVDIDTTSKTIHKVPESQLAQFNYILTVGTKEADAGTVCVRKRDSDGLHSMNVDSAIAMFRKEVASFSASSHV